MRVEDGEGVVARELLTSGPANGSVVWDGRTDSGALADDGVYFFVLTSGGKELLRRRVVLDTNRSKVVDALGSDFVGFTNLTCPMPRRGNLRGPAWLPDDSAAFFIVESADPNAPEFPVGLYRVSRDATSIEQIASGGAFSRLSFLELFSKANVGPVAPDGRHALVGKFNSDLQILNLETGALVRLFGHRFPVPASWSGERLLVADSISGLFVYDAEGNLVRELVTTGVEIAAWSPDGLQIVYRREDEIVLRLMNADGSDDRPLERTNDAVLLEHPGELQPGNVGLLDLFWWNGGDAFTFGWQRFEPEGDTGLLRLEPTTGLLQELSFFGDLSSDQRWSIEGDSRFHLVRRFGGRDTRIVIPRDVGRNLDWSHRDSVIVYEGAAEGCVGDSYWAVRTLLNGEADFRLTRLPSGFGIKISGTVADQNLDSYSLEFAPVSDPEALVAIQPPSSEPVVNDTLTTWVPPGPGDYLVRLTLRDKAGNVTKRLDRIFWEATLPIASLRRSPTFLSPNGDQKQDELLVEYEVLEPVNLEFHVPTPRDASCARSSATNRWSGPPPSRGTEPMAARTVYRTAATSWKSKARSSRWWSIPKRPASRPAIPRSTRTSPR